jgi:hypothetical protein
MKGFIQTKDQFKEINIHDFKFEYSSDLTDDIRLIIQTEPLEFDFLKKAFDLLIINNKKEPKKYFLFRYFTEIELEYERPERTLMGEYIQFPSQEEPIIMQYRINFKLHEIEIWPVPSGNAEDWAKNYLNELKTKQNFKILL